MAQDVFPKVDGDTTYASELNQFHRKNQLINFNQTVWFSGTDVVVGSFLIPSGLPFSRGIVDVFYTGTSNNGSNTFYIGFSGLNANGYVDIGTVAGGGGPRAHATMSVGISGVNLCEYRAVDAFTDEGFSTTAPPSVNLGSPFVVFLKATKNFGSSGAYGGVYATIQGGSSY